VLEIYSATQLVLVRRFIAQSKKDRHHDTDASISVGERTVAIARDFRTHDVLGRTIVVAAMPRGNRATGFIV
jgi:hypothetical protein